MFGMEAIIIFVNIKPRTMQIKLLPNCAGFSVYKNL